MLGDFDKEEFTDEEKTALGEVDDSKTDEGEGTGKTQEELDAEAQAKTDADAAEKAKLNADGSSKTEDKPDAETQAVIEKEGGKLITENGKQYVVDEDGAKIPLARFKKIYYQAKGKEETETKLNLFKTLGAEKYYEVYPDEKPADFKPVERKADPPHATADIYKMTVTGGQYDGWIVADVAKEDPIAAQVMVNDYLESKRTAKATEERKQEEFNKNFTAEKNAFLFERAKELFGKDKDYTPEEIKQVNDVYGVLSKWMIANKKSHYKMEDAYLLMNKDEIIKKTKVTATKEALKTATDKKVIPSIGNGDGSAGLTGFEAAMAMSEDALAKHIDKMSDAEFAKFSKDAPKALKDKFPSLPW
jgi:hypothetical protein